MALYMTEWYVVYEISYLQDLSRFLMLQILIFIC